MKKAILLATVAIVLTGCSHHPYGRLCLGEVSTLNGTITGQTHAWVFDEIQRFTVTHDGVTVQSGYLTSADPTRYIPSATTQQGYLAQRLSPDRFRLIDVHQDKMVTWTCPLTVTSP